MNKVCDTLTALLNSWTNSFIVFPPCSILFSFPTFTNSSSLLSNSIFSSDKNSPTDPNSASLVSNFSTTFSFYTSADSLCTYNKTYWICLSTIAPLILILRYNLYAVINSSILPASPLQTGGLATSMLDLVLDPSITPPSLVSAPPAIRACICAYIAGKYSCCCLIIICKSCWLIMLQEGRELTGDGDSSSGSSGNI